jgi:hypothetical protein
MNGCGLPDGPVILPYFSFLGLPLADLIHRIPFDSRSLGYPIDRKAVENLLTLGVGLEILNGAAHCISTLNRKLTGVELVFHDAGSNEDQKVGSSPVFGAGFEHLPEEWEVLKEGDP